METRTFGRRGAAAQAVAPIAFRSRVVAPREDVLPADAGLLALDPSERSLADSLPFMTVGLILFLLMIFGIQQRLAFDVGKGGQLSLESLIACGAVSYDRLIGSGEWWRAFLAPLLHGSYSHVFGNCFALFFIGLRLEPMIGRAWYGAAFVVSGLGGVAGSMIGNAHQLVTVGASGAITGLLMALFVVSFRHQGDAADAHAMRRTALRFGVPALAPLAFGASGHTDYFAHAGGAMAGGAVGLLLCAIWSDVAPRPKFRSEAAAGALLAVGIALVACVFARPDFAAEAEVAAQRLPNAEFANVIKASLEKSADLLARHPNDSRAHIIRAMALARARKLADAESELRVATSMPVTDESGRAAHDFAQAILGIVVKDEGRRGEAETIVSSLCRDPSQTANQALLKTSRLCE
jgi:rhomboid protease GluP